MLSATALPAKPPATAPAAAPTAAPTAVPTGPATVPIRAPVATPVVMPPAAAPRPVPTGCAPARPLSGSRWASLWACFLLSDLVGCSCLVLDIIVSEEKDE